MPGRFLLAGLLLLLPVLAAADDIYLKGGGKVSGRILSRTDTSVEIDVGAGKVTLPMSAVLRIEERRSALHDYHDRASALRADDLKGWLELARWATKQGLGTQARQAYERVLRVDPSHAEANRAVGHVLLDGVWMTEEQSYLARGFVRFEGEWMLPPEREAILRERQGAAEAERRQLDAEVRARDAELRAMEAEARAREAEAAAAAPPVGGIPLWWGWGSWGPWPVWPNPPIVVPPVPPNPRPPGPRPPGPRPRQSEGGARPRAESPPAADSPPSGPTTAPPNRPATKPLPKPGGKPGGKPG